MRTTRLLIAALVETALATACADLTAIQRFAATSARSAEYTQLVDAYVAAPERTARFAPERKRAELDDLASQRALQRKGLLALHTAVEEYMRALANLAADEAVDYDKDYDALGKALTDAKFVDQGEADAVEGLGALLTRAVTDGYRQRKLCQVIEEANAPLQTIIANLRAIVRAIEGDATGLEDNVDTYYRTAVQNTGVAGVGAILEGWRYRDGREAAALREAAKTYGDALDAIASGHAALFESREDLDTAEVRRQMTRYANDIRKVIDTLTAL